MTILKNVSRATDRMTWCVISSGEDRNGDRVFWFETEAEAVEFATEDKWHSGTEVLVCKLHKQGTVK